MSIDVAEIRRTHVSTRNKRCRSCSHAPFPCEMLKAADEIEALRGDVESLTAERDLSYRQADELSALYKDLQARSQGWLDAANARATVFESRRNEVLMQLASANEEKAQFRRQRDEAREGLSALLGTTT